MIDRASKESPSNSEESAGASQRSANGSHWAGSGQAGLSFRNGEADLHHAMREWLNCLALRSTLHDRLGEDAAIDLPLPLQLGLREIALSSGLQKEAIFFLAV